MRIALCSLAVSCLLGLPWTVQAQMPPPPLPKSPEMTQALQQLLTDLRLAKEIASRLNDPQARQHLQALLDRIELNARRVGDLSGDGVFPLLIPASMVKKDFEKLVQAIKAKRFDNERYQILTLSARESAFTCEQARTLVKLFGPTGDGPKNVAIALFQRVVDPQNYHIVVEALTFPNDRQAVLKALGIR